MTRRATVHRPALCIASLLAAALVAATGCVTPPLEPLSAERSTAALEPDEQALWKQSRELQYRIESAGLLLDDPALDAYLARVLARVTPASLRASGLEPRIEVVSDVNVDGYSFANGVIYLHTGLLARLDDETELAAVLARELAHVIGRNALRAKRERRQRADQLAWIGVGSALVQGGGQLKLLAQAAALTSAVGFDHTVETIADERGLAILDAAGYAVGETPALYEDNLAYLQEVHAQGVWGWVPWVAPPQITARVARLRTLIAEGYADQGATRPPILAREAFRRVLHSATIRQTELELAAGLFPSAETTALRATASDPRDPEAWLLLGRALEGQRTKPFPGRPAPSIRRVREAYAQALAVDPASVDAVRALGMSFYRTTGSRRPPEDRAAALRHLRRYLQVAPAAPDREYVEGYVRELEREER